jgi:hypothetical protein
MTIPYVGRCVGSGARPIEGSERLGDDGQTTALCPACSARFPLRDGALPEHETAPEDEREQLPTA